jgi:Tfp pilus assembly protein PilX
MNIRGEDGVALVVALMAMLLLTVLGAALVLTTSSETIIAANFRSGAEALYAADAALERAVNDLVAEPDWSALLAGTVQSSFIDGASSGARALADGSTIDLAQAVNMANCRKATPCSAGEMDMVTSDRPWGANNPRWQLYAYGPVNALVPSATATSPYYAVVMVGDDASENDNDPATDGASAANPGTGVLALRAEVFGPRGVHKVVEAAVARADGAAVERESSERPDDQNQRSQKGAVQKPGKELSMTTVDINPGGER